MDMGEAKHRHTSGVFTQTELARKTRNLEGGVILDALSMKKNAPGVSVVRYLQRLQQPRLRVPTVDARIPDGQLAGWSHRLEEGVQQYVQVQ